MEEFKHDPWGFDPGLVAIEAKINEIVNKLNDLEQIVYDFTGHVKP